MYELYFDEQYEGGYDHGLNTRIEIREGLGKHQLAIIDYPIPVSDYTDLAPGGTPMTLVWGTSSVDKRVFNGYVNHHEYWDDLSNSARYLRFYCTGMSQPMNDPRPGSWKNVSGSYIARIVAERNGLRSVLHQPDFVLAYWTQGQDSDFVMMNRLAKETGYRFWVDGPTLYFVDPRISLSTFHQEIPTYTMDRTPDDTLVRVQAIAGPSAPVGNAPVTQRIFGIDSSSNRFFQANSTRQTSDLGLPAPTGVRVLAKDVSSLAEAQRLNESAALEGSWTSIEVTTVGDAKARVGGTVTLDGDALNQSFQGEWAVTSLAHVIHTTNGVTKYRAQIDLTRNQQDGNIFFGTTNAKSAITDVPAVLRGGKTWESEILESVYV